MKNLKNLKEQLIKLGYERPELRRNLKPILDVVTERSVTARRGKILDEHADALEKAIQDYVQRHRDRMIEHKEELKHDPTVRDLDKRFRWDLFWQLPDSFTRDWINEVYEYANDNHVDTLLRQIVRDLRL